MVDEIQLAHINLPAHYVREVVNQEHVEYLADDIARRGLLEPLLVRPLPDGHYELINGVHRFHALKKLGRTSSPCNVRETSDKQALAVQVITNYRNRRLRDHELVCAVATMHEGMEMRLEEIGRELGYGKSYISKLYSIWTNKELYQQLREGTINLRAAYEKLKNEKSFPGKPEWELRCFVCERYGSPDLYIRPSACSAHAQYLTVAMKAARVMYTARKEDGLKELSERIDKLAGELVNDQVRHSSKFPRETSGGTA